MKRAQLVVLSILFLSLAGFSQNFTHVIIVIQENRTPDSLFQGLCMAPYGTSQSCSTTPTSSQYNIQTANWLNKYTPGGVTQPLTVPLADTYDLAHASTSWAKQCDLTGGQCLMDGVAKVACNPRPGSVCPTQPQFRYVYPPTEIAPYLALATQYGWANDMFQTNQGSSYPAHQFLFGGTSAPSAADDAKHIYVSSNGTAAIADAIGCIAEETTTVTLISLTGHLSPIFPCFEHETLADLMSGVGTWRYYAPAYLPGGSSETSPKGANIWTAPNSIGHICQSTGYDGTCAGWGDNVVLDPATVLSDTKKCQLANLSWVIPTGQNSDHAGMNTGGGPDWVASVVNVIGENPQCPNGETYWNDTAIIITWDDWGGWYDHVPPSAIIDEYQYGFRVPMIFVSAYTPAGYIDNGNHDFGSILRFVEGNFGIEEGALGFADARASDDLSTFYNFNGNQAPRLFVPITTSTDAETFIRDKTPPTAPDDD